MHKTMVALAICAATLAIGLARATEAIHVGNPKVYDDRYLRERLRAIQQRLTTIQALDPATLGTRLGTFQGGASQQSNISLTAAGRPVPSVKTTTGATESVVTDQGAVTPAAPSVPTVPAPAAAALTTAPTIGTSALNLLEEQMQLAYQVTNLQLLLEGALSDQFQLRGGGKKRITLGVPITIDLAAGEHEGKIAEVEITVCNSDMSEAAGEPPTVVTLLPQENTYNTLAITDDSTNIGLGLVAGVFNVTGGWFRSERTYFAVKQQDTLALLRSPATDTRCGVRETHEDHRPVVAAASRGEVEKNGNLETVYKVDGKLYEMIPRVTFAWQIRPTLGRKSVQNGLRNHFVQLSLANVDRWFCSGNVFVRTRWLPDKKHWWQLDEPVPPVEAVNVGRLAEYDTRPYTFDVDVTDLGDGNVLLTAQGVFLDGLRLRVGSTLLDTSGPDHAITANRIRAKIPVDQLARYGMSLVSPTGEEHPVVAYPNAVRPYKERTCYPSPQVDGSQDKPTLPQFAIELLGKTTSDTDQNDSKTLSLRTSPEEALRANCRGRVRYGRESLLRIAGEVKVQDRFDGTSLVTIPLGTVSKAERDALDADKCFKPEHERNYPIVAMIGGKVYGLGNAPFESLNLPVAGDRARSGDIRVVVPTESLADRLVKVERLMAGRWYSSGWERLTDAAFSVSKIALVSKTQTTATYMLTGAGLDGACLVASTGEAQCGPLPAGKEAAPAQGGEMRLKLVNPGMALVSAPVGEWASVKQLILRKNDSGSTLTVAVPTEDKPKAPVKGTLTKPYEVAVGAPILEIAGSDFDKIASIKYLDKEVGSRVAKDGKRIIIEVPPGFAASEGKRYLEITHADKTTERIEVAVNAPKSSGGQ